MDIATLVDTNNPISLIAAIAFTTIIGGLVNVTLGIYKLRVEAKSAKAAALEAKDVAASTKEIAETAVSNTAPVSNGFARGVTAKLDHILGELKRQNEINDAQTRAMQEHLTWHLQKGNPNE